MKQKIIESLRKRIENELTVRNPVSFLKTVDIEIIYSSLVMILYLYTRNGRGPNKNIYLAEVVTAIGNRIRANEKLKLSSGLSAKTGAFILYTVDVLGMIVISKGKGENNHGTYIIELVEERILEELWEGLTFEHVEKLPSLEPYADWTSNSHPTGASLVKTASMFVKRELSPEKHPIVFETVNKSQHVGWMINEQVYDLHLWALRNKTEAFQEIWDMQSPIAKQSKIREAKAIGGIARRFIGKVFYH